MNCAAPLDARVILKACLVRNNSTRQNVIKFSRWRKHCMVGMPDPRDIQGNANKTRCNFQPGQSKSQLPLFCSLEWARSPKLGLFFSRWALT